MFLIFKANTGKKVATKKEINNSDSVIKVGKYFLVISNLLKD